MSTYKEKTKHKHKSSFSELDLTCPSCDNQIDPNHVNINSTLAKCNHCDSILFLDDEDFFGRKSRNRPEMMIPEGTEVLHLPSSLDIRTKWSRGRSKGGSLFLVFFTVLWNAMILPAAISMIMSGGILSVLPMAIHLAVGLGLIYYILTLFLNHTDIYVTDSEITISNSKPIRNPFMKDKLIPTKDLKQLYVSKYVSSRTNGIANYAYALYAITNKGRRQLLLRGMNKETQLYIEQEIEHFLEIDDEKVRDEVPN